MSHPKKFVKVPRAMVKPLPPSAKSVNSGQGRNVLAPTGRPNIPYNSQSNSFNGSLEVNSKLNFSEILEFF